MTNFIHLSQSHIFYGGDYNPEQWAYLEPRKSEYTLDWFDRVVALLHENDIELCLATATASPPRGWRNIIPKVCLSMPTA